MREAFRAGDAVEPAELVGQEFRGFNVAPLPRLLGFQKFRKGFFTETDAVEGYNRWVIQDPPRQAWTPTPDKERHGFYLVTREGARQPGAVLLDYGASARNARANPERMIRDELVAVDRAAGVYLGAAYLAVARGARVFSNYFVLERDDQ